MITVGIIPLDSRPCNYTWIKELSEIANINTILYPRDKCGNLHQGAQIDEMFSWLWKHYMSFDYLIISTDGLTFGGLIQARKAQIDVDEAILKLGELRKLKAGNKKLKIYVLDTVMRTSITSINSETEKYWAKMNRFSQLKGLYHFFKNDSDKVELEQLEHEIPSSIIDTYLHAREVKLAINKYYLYLLKDGIIDYEIILQEDSMPYGVQKIDQEVLETIIINNSLQDKVKFHNGTDEGTAVLLAKIIYQVYNYSIKVCLHVPSNDVLEKVYLFEDRPFSENLEKMIDTIGLKMVEDSSQADYILSIYSEKENKDLDLSTYSEVKVNKNEAYYSYINEINQFIAEGKNVAFVDLLFPNGGSFEVLKDINYRLLNCYSAWNTPCNALGTLLCQLVANSSNLNKGLNEKFKNERIIDDCIYQYIVRRIVSKKLIDMDINIYDLKDNHDYALNLVKKELRKYDYLFTSSNYEVSLPWNRMFEAEIIFE